MIHVRGRGERMNESILNTIKTMIGLSPDDAEFNTDILVFVNSALMTLRQIGIGPQNGFSVSDSTQTWSEFIEDIRYYESVKSYIYLKVRLMFDPPATSYVSEQMKTEIQEIEWRLKVEKEEIEEERKS